MIQQLHFLAKIFVTDFRKFKLVTFYVTTSADNKKGKPQTSELASIKKNIEKYYLLWV